MPMRITAAPLRLLVVVDQVEDHVAAGPQPLADVEDELVAKRLRLFEGPALGGLHSPGAVLRPLVLRNGGDRDEKSPWRDFHDVCPDLIGSHGAIVTAAPRRELIGPGAAATARPCCPRGRSPSRTFRIRSRRSSRARCSLPREALREARRDRPRDS